MIALAVSSDVSLVITGAIAIFVVVISPIYLLHLTNRQSQQAREAEWEHQEEMDLQARRDLIAGAPPGIPLNEKMSVAQIQAAINKAISTQVGVVGDKVDVVHGFVNNDALAGRQRELDAAERELDSVRRELVLLARLDESPREDMAEQIATTNGQVAAIKRQIADLQTDVDERQRQAKRSAAQIEALPGSEVGGS